MRLTAKKLSEDYHAVRIRMLHKQFTRQGNHSRVPTCMPAKPTVSLAEDSTVAEEIFIWLQKRCSFGAANTARAAVDVEGKISSCNRHVSPLA